MAETHRSPDSAGRPPAVAPASATRTVILSVERDLLGDPSLLRQWGRFPGRLRGRSLDRLRSRGERFFVTRIRPTLRPEALRSILEARAGGAAVLLESDSVVPIIRPLARSVGATHFRAYELETRAGRATGRRLAGVREFLTDPPAGSDGARPPAVQIAATDETPAVLEVRRAIAGRHLLIVGGTGFIGKVWLAHLLRSCPDLGRITLMIRARAGAGAQERWESVLHSSPVFDILRDEWGDSFDERVAAKIDVVEGDVQHPQLGLAAEDAARLTASVDVLVNSAGLTDFHPDLRDATSVNIDGPLHLLDFARDSGMAYVHISTCYVAGQREGRIAERLAPNETPAGATDLDPEAELRWLRQTIAESTDAGSAPRRTLIEKGRQRAVALGWPNVYTYTKALGEALLALRAGSVPLVTVRPSIVESSWSFPFPGWNEGINTSCPLSYLLGTAFRQLPVNDRKRLDIVPVDRVARGLTLVTAALLERRHEDVYQLATSATNPLDLARAVELTALAHGRHYREVGGWRERILARLEAVPVSRERYERFSVPRYLRVAQRLNRWLRPGTPGKRKLVRAERTLRRVHELVELYEPFLLNQEPIFEADRVAALSAALSEEEREHFAWDVHALDWYDYWTRIHIPGLRLWSYPLLEGREAPNRQERTAQSKAAVDAGLVPQAERIPQ